MGSKEARNPRQGKNVLRWFVLRSCVESRIKHAHKTVKHTQSTERQPGSGTRCCAVARLLQERGTRQFLFSFLVFAV